MTVSIYDVYLNHRKDLLVLPKGNAIPGDLDGSWQRRKRARSVSEPIRAQIARFGFYQRRSGKQDRLQQQPG
jgi:hypothetical protein